MIFGDTFICDKHLSELKERLKWSEEKKPKNENAAYEVCSFHGRSIRNARRELIISR